MICSYSARFGITIYFVSDIIGSHMLAQYSDKKIGGSGMTVEIDESLFGKPMGFILCYPHYQYSDLIARQTQVQQGKDLWPS